MCALEPPDFRDTPGFDPLQNAKEKFHDALERLATGREGLSERARRALQIIRAVRSEDLPPHIRRDYESIQIQLLDEGDLDARVARQNMDEHSALAIAQQILLIYDKLVPPWKY